MDKIEEVLSSEETDLLIKLDEGMDVKIDPRDTSPPEGSPRWNEVYKKMKDFERDLESEKKEKQNLKELVDEMKAFNQKLSSSLESQTEAIVGMTSFKSKDSFEDTMKQLKAEKREAMENLDYDKVDILEDKIFELKMQKTKEIPKPIKPTYTEQDVNILKDFVETVSWYKDDPEMRAYANMLDESFLSDNVWGKKPIKERLLEVKKRTEKRFGMSTKVSGVEDGKEYGKGNISISLSSDEQNLAKAFGISQQEWAKQKSYIGGRK